MNVYEVPVTPSIPQEFTTTLAGVTYQLTLKWNEFTSSWILDIADEVGNGIVSGIPLVTDADLLEQYAYLEFGGQLVVQTDYDPQAVPTFDNLGDTSHLYFVTT